MVYRVEVMPQARKALHKLPPAVASRIIAALDELVHNPRPRGAVKLANTADAWRIRIGDYRVLYEIEDQRLLVYVIRIAHRRDAYRR